MPWLSGLSTLGVHSEPWDRCLASFGHGVQGSGWGQEAGPSFASYFRRLCPRWPQVPHLPRGQ